VVQSTDKAEGYVFQNIENVTIGHGLPEKNSGMPEPSNSDDYTVSQLYQTVKKLSRVNGGLKYTTSEASKYLFAYTQRADGISYQQRSTDGLSNRAILANVLSEVAQDDREASMLKLYTDNVQRLDEQIVRLAVINAEIKQKSFGKGKRDTARLAELKAEQSAIQKEVVKYDKQSFCCKQETWYHRDVRGCYRRAEEVCKRERQVYNASGVLPHTGLEQP